VLQELQVQSHYNTADLPSPPSPLWIQTEWERARLLEKKGKPVILVLDEVQKIYRWSEMVKRLWDEDRARRSRLRVVLLSSSSLLIQKGLTESLAGRFEILRCFHWDYRECAQCFGWSLDQYLECAVGAHLFNEASSHGLGLFYWRRKTGLGGLTEFDN